RIPGKSDLAKAFRYALSRWRSFCLFLEDGRVAIDNNPAELSGLGPLSGQAIVTDEAGDTMLRLGFSLSLRGSRPSPPTDEDEADTVSVTASPRRLRLLALLHYLWDAAGLTTWRKAYGRRSWWIVHRELCLAAARARTGSGPLSDILFVPPPYVLEDKERLAGERRRFLHRLRPVAGKPTGLGLLVAELKGQEPAQYGRKLRFKHLPDFSVFVDSDTAKRFDRAAARKVRLVEATPNSHLMAIATFAVKGNYAEIREIALMAVDGRWIPFAGERDHGLLQALAERDFVRCLPYNLPVDAPIATAVLLDGDGPIALYAPAPDMAADREEDLRRIAAEGIYPAWHWPAGVFDMPELPRRVDHGART
ncbi:DUF1173 family protein, partial [Paracoccus sp. KCTC 42845]|nr:DUF1173 family protein [Paracoccus aerius]